MTIERAGPWPPRPSPSGKALWHWAPKTVADLPRIRSELREGLARLPGHRQPELEEVLPLLLDELLANGLRHGNPPVTAEVRRSAREWVVEVGDQASAAAPEPAVGRDPALGGMGLHIVASLSSAHGWFVEGGRKFVWTSLPAV
ncbi:ATP-binding protein [Blastococcus haudaquaticus]|nr:ATP-binding protein [Blastococcus haudaquaticus]